MITRDWAIAVAVAVAGLAFTDWYEPYGWLAVIVFVPWFLLFVLQVGRRHDLSRGMTVAGMVIGAAIVMTYYYPFFIGALALIGLFAVRPMAARRGIALGPKFPRRTGSCSLGTVVISAVYWLPLLVAIVTTPGAQGYQNRYLDPATVDVPLPFLTFDLVGLVLLFGLGYLGLSTSLTGVGGAARAARRRLRVDRARLRGHPRRRATAHRQGGAGDPVHARGRRRCRRGDVRAADRGERRDPPPDRYHRAGARARRRRGRGRDRARPGRHHRHPLREGAAGGGTPHGAARRIRPLRRAASTTTPSSSPRRSASELLPVFVFNVWNARPREPGVGVRRAARFSSASARKTTLPCSPPRFAPNRYDGVDSIAFRTGTGDAFTYTFFDDAFPCGVSNACPVRADQFDDAWFRLVDGSS